MRSTDNYICSEQTINEIKNTVFYDGERQLITSLPEAAVRDNKTWNGYCAQKQVAVLRAAAGIPPFLNQVRLHVDTDATLSYCRRSGQSVRR